MNETWKRILKITGWSLAGIVGVVIIGITAFTLYLTPDRLTEIVNREANENLDARVDARNIRFTFWSSFPHLRIRMDSVSVISKTLRGLSPEVRDALPEDADRLLSTGAFSGGINILDLLRGKISLSDVEVAHLDLNLVGATDSINNYSIYASGSGPEKVPYFTFKGLVLKDPKRLRWTSLPAGAVADIDLSAARVDRNEKDRDRYHLKLDGRIDVRVNDFDVLKGFPFGLDGNIDLRFDPFGIKTDHYAVNLGELQGNVNLNMQVGDDMKINSFEYRLDNFNLLQFLARFPGVSLPSLKSLESDLVVNASARLTSPYSFSSTALPSAELDFNVAEGDLKYTLSDGRSYSLRHDPVTARLIFTGNDPDDSSFILDPVRLSGSGTDISLQGSMDRVFAQPLVNIELKGNVALTQLSDVLKDVGISSLKGNLDADASTSFRLTDIKGGDIRALDLKGEVGLKEFSASFPASRLTAAARSLKLTFSGDAGTVDSLGFSDAKVFVKGEGSGLAVNGRNLDISANGLDIDASCDIANGSVDPDKIDFSGKAASLKVKAGGDVMDMSGLDLDLSASKRKKLLAVAPFNMPEGWTADKRSLDMLSHSSEFIIARLPEKYKKLIRQWDVESDLSLRKGFYSSKAFPLPTSISDLDLSASLDAIDLRSLSLRSGISAMKMSGAVENLSRFLLSSTPVPLKLNMDVAIDTMQLNQIAGAYEKGRYQTKGETYHPSSGEVTSKDTVAMLVPRNLFADIHATARQTRYTNLHLYDLSCGVSLHDGDAELQNLKISADFGHAFMDLAYHTANIQNINMDISMGMDDINVVKFFQNFHSLLEMMPEMANLSGNISANATMNFLAFPNMYVNIPSVTADIYARAWDLKVKQSAFIRKIMRMLLIRQKGVLDIANMNVHASMHDNLLELYPFDFILDRYRLRLQGVNNYNGDLYYHIGVDKSPVPFPFGINIVGHFSKPKLRFGGATYKIDQGQKITSSVMETHHVNIIAEVKKYMGELVHKAAVSE